MIKIGSHKIKLKKHDKNWKSQNQLFNPIQFVTYRMLSHKI